MSCIRCQSCDRIIDSDFDLECFELDERGKDYIICEWCRNKREADQRQQEEWKDADSLL